MQFLFPWMLLGSLGIAVPIAIHLLNRFRYRVVDWGAMELLRKALITRQRRIKIEDWLLLMMRCLIIVLIALALSRPVLAPTGPALDGKGGDVGVVIALDASFSMQHSPGAKSRFKRATDRVDEISKTLKPGNPVTFIVMGDRPRVVVHNLEFDADRFHEILKETTSLPEGLNLESCLIEIQERMKGLNAATKECYIVSDMQADTWSSLSEKTKQTLKELGEDGRVFCLPILSKDAENLAITRLELKSGVLQPEATARYDIDVLNAGLNERKNIAVGLF